MPEPLESRDQQTTLMQSNQTTSLSQDAVVTMVLTDSYVIGALVLGHSFLRHNPEARSRNRRMICLVVELDEDKQANGQRIGVSRAGCKRLEALWELHRVELLDSQDSTRLALLKRPELGISLTKLHVWSLWMRGVQRALFLDADMLVIAPMDIEDLLSRPELAAVADSGWPDCFNSGLFVCRPNPETHSKLLTHAAEHGSFDGTPFHVLTLRRRGSRNPEFVLWKGMAKRQRPSSHPLHLQCHCGKCLHLRSCLCPLSQGHSGGALCRFRSKALECGEHGKIRRWPTHPSRAPRQRLCIDARVCGDVVAGAR